MNIIKKDIVKFLKNNHFTDVHLFIDTLVEVIQTELSAGHAIHIKNFGLFDILDKKSRKGMNFCTKKQMNIDARKAVSFKASKHLKNKLKQMSE